MQGGGNDSLLRGTGEYEAHPNVAGVGFAYEFTNALG